MICHVRTQLFGGAVAVIRSTGPVDGLHRLLPALVVLDVLKRVAQRELRDVNKRVLREWSGLERVE